MNRRWLWISLAAALVLAPRTYALDIVNRGQGKVENGVYESLDKSYTVVVPTLMAESIHIRDKADVEGITYRVQFLGENSVNASIVSTKIRAEFPQNDLVLERVGSKQKQEYLRESGYLESLEFIGTEEGKIHQSIVRYIGVGHPAQVRDGFLGTMVEQPLDVFGVHRYIVRNGYLYEFIVVVPELSPDGPVPEEHWIREGLREADALMRGFRINGKADEKVVELLNGYKPKPTYIVNKVSPPVRDKPDQQPPEGEKPKHGD